MNAPTGAGYAVPIARMMADGIAVVVAEHCLAAAVARIVGDDRVRTVGLFDLQVGDLAVGGKSERDLDMAVGESRR